MRAAYRAHERMAGERGTRQDREEYPIRHGHPNSRNDRRGDRHVVGGFVRDKDLGAVRVTAIKMLQATVAELLVVLREAAANQRHVEGERLPGRGDRAVVAIYAQLVVVVWGVRRDGHDLDEVEGGRGQH